MNLALWNWKNPTRNQSMAVTGPQTLDRVQPGTSVIVTGYAQMDLIQQNFLKAYGLLPGREVKVLQHKPETVIQIEYSELAFEKEIAQQVLVRAK